jgi:hypothetical protein
MQGTMEQETAEQSQLLVMAGLLGQKDLSQKPELTRLAEQGWEFKDNYANGWILGREKERIFYDPIEDKIEQRYD